MTLLQGSLLFGVAVVGGAVNSVAGGGSFLCFPVLLFTGVSPVNGNATNTVALWPGTLASVGAYRGEFRRQGARQIIPLVLTGVSGAHWLQSFCCSPRSSPSSTWCLGSLPVPPFCSPSARASPPGSAAERRVGRWHARDLRCGRSGPTCGLPSTSGFFGAGGAF